MNFKEYKSKFVYSLIVCLLPVVSYLVLGPLEIYMGNRSEFLFTHRDFMGYTTMIAIACWIAMTVIISLFPAKVCLWLNSLVLAGGAASYIQNMFMNIKLSELNGAPMDWSSVSWFVPINLAVWAAIFITCIIFTIKIKKWRNISMAVAGFLSAIQLVAVISLLINARGVTVDYHRMSGEKQFEVASEENVIVFVEDTFGTAQLENVVAQYPDAMDTLSDFTYYNNADCHYYRTYPSMTCMLTGIDFSFDEYGNDWLEEAWHSERSRKFYDILKDNGYKRYIYSDSASYVYGSEANLSDSYDNIVEGVPGIDHKLIVKKLVKYSIYRYVPYIMKPRFEGRYNDFMFAVIINECPWIQTTNFWFGMDVRNKFTVDNTTEKAFMIQHLEGTHEPYGITDKGEWAESSSQVETGRGCISILQMYFDQLKAHGLYDSSTIIILADHGDWVNGDMQPIMFIKKKNETHDSTQICSAPVSLDDFQATVLELIGEKHDGFGTSVYDWSEGDIRERVVYQKVRDFLAPVVNGMDCTSYQKYTYYTNLEELKEKVDKGEYEELPAPPRYK